MLTHHRALDKYAQGPVEKGEVKCVASVDFPSGIVVCTPLA